MNFLFRYWPEAGATLSGVLLALCYANWNIGGFVWVWQAPLLCALWFSKPRESNSTRWKRGFYLGYLSGLSFFVLNVSWITEVSRTAGTIWAGVGSLLTITLYLALYFALFGAFAATVGRWTITTNETAKPDVFGSSLVVLRVAFLNGSAWCGLEWLRGILFTGFGWNGLGVALKEQLLLVQFADVIGITGYGFILMFTGIIAFCTFVRLAMEVRGTKKFRPHLDFAVGVGLIIGLFLYGTSSVLKKPGKTVELKARILQLNIPLEDKWSEDPRVRQKIVFDYRDLTRTFVELSPHDLVIWPETALPGHFTFPWVQEYFNDHILKGDEFTLITGLEDSNLEDTEIYNTITVMQGSTETFQMHRKIHLVPMGEFIPFRNTFPLFEWIGGGIIERDFTPGDSYEPIVIEKQGHEIGIIPLICFEDTFSRHTRKFIRPGPQVLVNVTNDGWFYDSAQPTQHFDNAIFRCIELRRPMIRAANTGVSGFIDERGSLYERESTDRFPRILRDEESGSTYIRGSLPATLAVDLDPPMTVYARFGDAFSISLGIIAILAAGISGVRNRKQS